MKAFNILQCLIFIIVTDVFSQTSEVDIDQLRFEIKHEFYIPFNHVEITIMRTVDKQSAFAWVRSRPANDEPQWNYSKIDSRFDIEIEKFNSIAKEMTLLENTNLEKADEQISDGNYTTLEYGFRGRFVAFKFCSPEAYTDERDLNLFVKLCNDFITLAKLDPKVIFPE